MAEDTITLKISLPKEYVQSDEEWEEFQSFADGLARSLSTEKQIYSAGGGEGQAFTLLLGLVTGGALSTLINAIYNGISAYLRKHEGRELTFSTPDKKITLKGRDYEEEMKLLQALFPELVIQVPDGECYVVAYFDDPNRL